MSCNIQLSVLVSGHLGGWRWTSEWAIISVVLLMGWRATGVDPEGEALLSWSKTLSGSSALSSWDVRDENPCRWIGISCSSRRQGSVTGINLPSMELLGTVPSQFGPLKDLQSLVISAANLTGAIPREIGSYSNLALLDLSENGLTGSIPAEIGMLKNLHTLILNSNQLEGTIPPEIGDCKGLRNLIIFDNQLKGEIPPDFGRLQSLEILRLGGNENIEGALPGELSNCANLTTLGLAETSISGGVPPSFGRLKKLKTLAMYSALLSGSIPPELGNCSELVNLYLYENSLSGILPRELGKLNKLEKLFLWRNAIVGSIPAELGNCKALRVVDLSANFMSGNIPAALGNLTDLIDLRLSDNNLSGPIPPVLAKCTGLTQLQLDNNQLSGEIPAEFGRLKHLVLLFAWQNQLEGRIPPNLGDCEALEELDLSHNRLTGVIPATIFQLKNLTKLLLLSNDLTGGISPEIGNCTALVRLRLGDNNLGDSIPKEIARLKRLIFLDLGNNLLSGVIPSEIGNCRELEMLDLHGNRLRGSLPHSMGLLVNLHVVDASMNRLTGSIPAAFGNLSSLNKLTLNGNRLSGAIPSELSSCTNLLLLDLSANRLIGGIPPEIGRIQGLDIALNLSWNYLSGPIPAELSGLTNLAFLDLSHNTLSGNLTVLAELENLVTLNVSYNNFTGALPDTNFFRELSPSDLYGNAGLCTSGSDVCFAALNDQLTEPEDRRSGTWYSGVKLAICILFSLTAIMVFLGACLLMRARSIARRERQEGPWQMTPFQKLGFAVEQVVDSLVDGNIIGNGCSGVVYKVDMPNGDVIAVKKLWPGNKRSERLQWQRDSFSAEVKTLGSIRHRNIVRLLGCCSNLTTKLLMYDYMPNGSLGVILHEKRYMLDWEIRYNILLGAAQGLAYLHHDCLPAILHRDVKSNNILLGPRFEPYLADFGLAKLIDSSAFAKSSTTVAGSYGYMAPEYGYSTRITEKSDVYSYGVVAMEVLTGRQPVLGDVHLVQWVRETLRIKRDAVEVIDPRLQGRPDSHVQEMLQALGVALLCVNSNPDERPTMKDVATLLNEIRHEHEDYGKVDVLKQRSPATDQSIRKAKGDAQHSDHDLLKSSLLSSTSSSILAFR